MNSRMRIDSRTASRVPFQRRPVPNQHDRGSQAQQDLASGGNHRWMGIHNVKWIEADQIRFQQDRFAPNRQIELSQSFAKNRGDIGLVAGHTPDRDARCGPHERQAAELERVAAQASYGFGPDGSQLRLPHKASVAHAAVETFQGVSLASNALRNAIPSSVLSRPQASSARCAMARDATLCIFGHACSSHCMLS